MKKRISILLAVLSLGSLWAEKPRRYVEAGFTLDAGFANNYLKYEDFFNDGHVVRVNFNQMGRYDFNLVSDVAAQTFFKVSGERFSVGVFAGLDGMFYGSISKQLFQLLSNGNRGSYSKAEFAFGGALFADTGINVETQLGKLRLRISPAVFLPVVYIPKPKKMDVTIKTGEDTMSITGNVALDIYSPVKLGSGGDISVDMSGLSRVTDSGALGFDLTLGAEYPMASILDAGILVSHIPVGLSRLTHQAKLQADFSFNENAEGALLDQLKEGNIDDILHIGDPEFSFSRGVFYVSRPMRFDLYSRIKFIGNLVVLCPQVGISLFTPYGDIPCFNAGLEGQLNVWRLLQLSLGSGYEELVWKHRFGLILNLRVLQLDLGVSTQSQEFIQSFTLSGLGLSVGVHVGF